MPLIPAAETLRRRVANRFFLWFWMLFKLPAALFCGVRLHTLTEARCVTSVPFGWRSQNPFKSTYFAAQAMAAELSTGAIVLLAAEDAGVPISTLIVSLDSTFGKKAVDRVFFTCEAGVAIFDAVQQAQASGEARTVTVETVGRMADGAETSRFRFTWSVKARRSAASPV